jgi:hypothetical protein
MNKMNKTKLILSVVSIIVLGLSIVVFNWFDYRTTNYTPSNPYYLYTTRHKLSNLEMNDDSGTNTFKTAGTKDGFIRIKAALNSESGLRLICELQPEIYINAKDGDSCEILSVDTEGFTIYKLDHRLMDDSISASESEFIFTKDTDGYYSVSQVKSKVKCGRGVFKGLWLKSCS